jgi:hypothetical protein
MQYRLAKNIGLIAGFTLGLPVLSSIVLAAPGPQQNPCPGIYYEEPHNSTRQSPQGCRPNAFTQSLIQQGRLSAGQYSTSAGGGTSQPLAEPANTQTPIAMIAANAGTVTVRLQNTTNARIQLQAVGATEQRYLSGGEEVVLRGLPIPITFTMVRQDGGLIRVTPAPNAEQGQLAISLSEATSLDQSQGMLRIERNGQVLAY